MDKVLPFGLRSAPELYNADADAFLWFLENSDGVEGLHGFLLFGNPQLMLTCSVALGVPVASRKTEGPSTTLTFLGLELDTLSMTVHLPPMKLE